MGKLAPPASPHRHAASLEFRQDRPNGFDMGCVRVQFWIQLMIQRINTDHKDSNTLSPA